MVILLVELKMLVEVVDAFGQKRDLNLRGPRVAFVNLIFRDDFLFGCH